MRKRTVFAALIACALLAPVAAGAQQTESVRVLSRSMLGVFTEAVNVNGQITITVTGVVRGSPAELAGLASGDVIVRIDGEPATPQRLSAPREPGETVRLRVRRGDSERDIQLVTVERVAGQQYAERVLVPTLPDSVLGQMAIVMSRVRSHMDSVSTTMRMQLDLDTLRMLTQRGDTFFIDMSDTARLRSAMRVMRLGDDSVRVFRYGTDSVHVFRYGPDSAAFRFPAAAARSIEMLERQAGIYRRADIDSLRARFDSARIAHARSAEVIALRRDAVDSLFAFSARPSDIALATVFAASTAVAGAELSELNPGLAEYFGVSEGVLVLNAAEGTPAARAGVRAGDVIVAVNGTPVRSIPEVRRALAPGAGAATRLRLLRRGQQIDVTIGG